MKKIDMKTNLQKATELPSYESLKSVSKEIYQAIKMVLIATEPADS